MQNKLFGSREFYRRVLAVAVPIMVQNVPLNVKTQCLSHFSTL